MPNNPTELEKRMTLEEQIRRHDKVADRCASWGDFRGASQALRVARSLRTQLAREKQR